MSNSNLESAKSILQRELDNCPYVKKDLWGHSLTQLKIETYVIESVKAGIGKGECLDWIEKFLQDNKIKNEYGTGKEKYSEIVGFMYSVLSRYISSEK